MKPLATQAPDNKCVKAISTDRCNSSKDNSKDLTDYFSSWDGWYCQVEDKHGEPCGEVIENTRKIMIRHLLEVHNIEVREVIKIA